MTEKEEEKKIVCPLKNAAARIASGPGGVSTSVYVLADTCTENCAWYIHPAGECALRVIAEKLVSK